MLVIFTKDMPNGSDYHVPFNIWDKRFNQLAQHSEGLVVQADGHELEVIEKVFPLWVPTGVRVAVFHGDIARAILSNIGRAR